MPMDYSKVISVLTGSSLGETCSLLHFDWDAILIVCVNTTFSSLEHLYPRWQLSLTTIL